MEEPCDAFEVGAAALWNSYVAADSEAAGSRGDPFAARKPRRQPEPPTAVPPLQPPWRCLVHSGEEEGACTSCTPAPAPGEADGWMLRGGAGSEQFGEKLLRAALLRCPEWQGVLPASLSLPDPLKALVRCRNSSLLRKVHFLELCWYWRYASPYWQRKSPPPGVRQRSGARTRPPGPRSARARSMQLAAPPAEPPLAALRRALMHDVTVFASVDRSFNLAAAVASEPRAPLSVLVPAILRSLLQVQLHRTARARADAGSLLAAAAQAGYDEPRGEECDCAEAHLALLKDNVIATQRATEALPAAALARLSSPDRALIQDVNEAMRPMFTFVSRATAELADLRLSHPTRADLLTAAASVCAAAAAVGAVIERRLVERAALAERNAGRRVESLSPYTLVIVEKVEQLRSGAAIQDPFFSHMRAID